MQPFVFNSYLAGFSSGIFLPLFIVLIIAILVLKGYALWYSARGSQKWWFIAMLILNTAGILEIVYLLFFRPKHPGAETPANTAPAHEEAPSHDDSSTA